MRPPQARRTLWSTRRACISRALLHRNRHNHPPLAVHVYKLFFLCQLGGGAPAHSTETDSFD